MKENEIQKKSFGVFIRIDVTAAAKDEAIEKAESFLKSGSQYQIYEVEEA